MKHLIAIVSLALGFASLVVAQTITPLVLDVVELGRLDANNPTLSYGFASEAGDIQIELLASGDLIPSYTLTDATNALIMQNTNPARDTLLTERVTLSATALYILTVEGVDASLGDFSLVVRSSVSAPPPVSATTCETVIEQAIEIIDVICRQTGRNEVCYGNLSVAIDTRDNIPVNFTRQGDIVPLALVDSLSLSPLDPDANEWGVALMQVQADLPDTLPGQNVSVLVFGNVAMTDTVETGSNMQSFYFTPGAGTSRCGDVPTDGILIRTPEGVGVVNLRVNEVDITLGSTAFLTVEPNRTLDVVMLEGIAQVRTVDGVQLLGTGQKVTIPVGEDSLPIAPPNFPQPINLDDYAGLPLDGLVESAPQPSQPIPTLQPTPQNTPSDTSGERPTLPITGDCVLRTFENTEVNVRHAPEGDIVSFIRPDRLYEVTGINAQGTWYRIASPFGWVAGFVTDRGGDCSNLPVIALTTPTPPATTTPAITSTPQPVGNAPIFINVDWFAPKATYQGTLSTTAFNFEDTLFYTFVNVPPQATGKQFEVSIRCEASPGALVFYNYDGSIDACSSINANYIQMGDFNINNTGSIIIFLDNASPPATVTWSILIGFSGNLP